MAYQQTAIPPLVLPAACARLSLPTSGMPEFCRPPIRYLCSSPSGAEVSGAPAEHQSPPHDVRKRRTTVTHGSSPCNFRVLRVWRESQTAIDPRAACNQGQNDSILGKKVVVCTHLHLVSCLFSRRDKHPRLCDPFDVRNFLFLSPSGDFYSCVVHTNFACIDFVYSWVYGNYL